MWYIVAIVVVLAVGFVVKLIKHSVITHFIVVYNASIDEGKGKEESLLAAVNFFRYRFPFDQLSEEDVRNILSITMELKDPLLLADAFQYCEQKRNISLLKNYAMLEKILQRKDQGKS